MKKTRHLIVRITEQQFRQVAQKLIIEQKNKSQIMRDALERYMESEDQQKEKKHLKSGINKKPGKEQSEKLPMKEKYISLDVEDVFPAGEFTPDEVAFGEHFLKKLGVDLESPVQVKYFLSPSQLIYLLTGIKREYDGFLGLEGKID